MFEKIINHITDGFSFREGDLFLSDRIGGIEGHFKSGFISSPGECFLIQKSHSDADNELNGLKLDEQQLAKLYATSVLFRYKTARKARNYLTYFKPDSILLKFVSLCFSSIFVMLILSEDLSFVRTIIEHDYYFISLLFIFLVMLPSCLNWIFMQSVKFTNEKRIALKGRSYDAFILDNLQFSQSSFPVTTQQRRDLRKLIDDRNRRYEARIEEHKSHQAVRGIFLLLAKTFSKRYKSILWPASPMVRAAFLARRGFPWDYHSTLVTYCFVIIMFTLLVTSIPNLMFVAIGMVSPELLPLIGGTYGVLLFLMAFLWLLLIIQILALMFVRWRVRKKRDTVWRKMVQELKKDAELLMVTPSEDVLDRVIRRDNFLLKKQYIW